MSQCVLEVLGRLPESYRTALALGDCDELSDRELASVLDVTVGAGRSRRRGQRRGLWLLEHRRAVRLRRHRRAGESQAGRLHLRLPARLSAGRPATGQRTPMVLPHGTRYAACREKMSAEARMISRGAFVDRRAALSLVTVCAFCLACGELPNPRWRATTGDASSAPRPLAPPAPHAANGTGTDPGGEVGQHGRAIVVSIDGGGAIYLREQLAYALLPTFAALQRAGASTLNARTDRDYTETLPNHTSILTGRPVTKGPGLPADAPHGWTANYQVPYTITLHNEGNPNLDYVASMFDVAHDHGRRTCLYAGKAKFSLFTNSYNAANGAPDRVGADDGRNKIDRAVILDDTESLITTAEADLAGGLCDLAFVHIADLDAVGHSSGWGGDAWLSCLAQVDQWIGRLFHFASPNRMVLPHALVVTADHGGFDSSHVDPGDPRDYTIPFYAIGAGVPGGVDLYALAAGRRVDPGSGRPDTAAPSPPVRNGDAANLALALMGLPPVPGSYFRDLLGPQ